MPVGDEPRFQSLVKLTRVDETHYEEEDLGEVMFVPRIGEQGWIELTGPAARPRCPASSSASP